MGPIGGPGAPGAPLRQLHLIGLTSDRKGLILAGRRGAKNGGYVVDLDDSVLTEIERLLRLRHQHLRAGDEERHPGARSRAQSLLTPREIQARLRAGRSIAQVATEAAVDVEWVDRFAAPVLAEQAAAVVRAANLPLSTQRRGDSDRPLGASVLRNLADRGIRLTQDELDEAWSALHHADHQWIVRFRYRSRGRDLEAEWVLDAGAGVVTASNKLGLELGFVDPQQNVSTVTETARVEAGFGGALTPWGLGVVREDEQPEEEDPGPTTRRSVARKRPPAAETPAPPTAVARRSATDKAVAETPAPPTAVAKRSATDKAVAETPAPPTAVAKRSAKNEGAPSLNGDRRRARPSSGRGAGRPGVVGSEPRT